MSWTNTVRRWLVKNESEMMLALGIAGSAVSVILSIKATGKAKQKLDEKRITEDKVKLTKKEIVKTAWKDYIPVVVTFSLSTACMIASYKANIKRNAILASALATSQAALSEYERAVKNTVGTEVAEKIQQTVAEKKIDETAGSRVIHDDTIVNEYECMESTTAQYFVTDKESIRKVMNDLNQERLAGFTNTVTLNDMYDRLGLERTTAGDYLGWDVDNPVRFDIRAVERQGVPYLYLEPQGWVPLV